MAAKIIGLVITKKTEEHVEGYLEKVEVYRGKYIGKLKQRNIHVNFSLNVKDKTFKIPIGHIDDAIEIGKRLERRGYRDLTLIFNDREIKISEI